MVRIIVYGRVMIVCSCNVIREADLRAAAGRGCVDAESAYAAMGCEFECGGCRDHADEIIVEALANPAEVDQRAA
jgi:bacterioferritin-associated ferredoxin